MKEYRGSYDGLIYDMLHKLEDTATVPEMHGGYPMAALIREWRETRKDLTFLLDDGYLSQEEYEDAVSFLSGIVDTYLTNAQLEFELENGDGEEEEDED